MLETIGHWMVVTDPPAHTRLRKLANHAFRQQRVNAMGSWIGELVDGLLDDFVASGSDDFLNDIAYPLPAAVIARMMGAPQQDRGKFQHWSDELALVAFGAGGEDRASRYTRALAGVRELQEYLAQLIEQRRREPGEDMISLLLGGVAADGDHLDDAELMALCSLILFAGHETTTNLLCNALVALDRHPAELARLREDPSMVNRAVEEVLRFEGPIKIIIRWVLEDHERDGRQVKAGDRVYLVQQSANRDAGTFTDPDRFDITRPTQPLHVGFGRGIHACLGAQLARIEARVALPKVLDRLAGLRVTGEVTWRPNIASRAVSGLTVGHG
jgi:cytochrome P450